MGVQVGITGFEPLTILSVMDLRHVKLGCLQAIYHLYPIYSVHSLSITPYMGVQSSILSTISTSMSYFASAQICTRHEEGMAMCVSDQMRLWKSGQEFDNFHFSTTLHINSCHSLAI
jgi:hypothetical protein